MLKIYSYVNEYEKGFSMEAEMDTKEDFALFMKIFQDAILATRTYDPNFSLAKKGDYHFITAYKLKQKLEFTFVIEDDGFGIWVSPAKPEIAPLAST
ncbi:hypothetical protein AAE02nite_18600 [Adhaeribacter aerolatus]|uniref:Uncharacterized protein n=1 Tax=Adhaeribacter aerolatus TaxID=670289 RepID=A0A512AWU7_9BACT|nr:hypothetical protein [Adhaeribacter aerolatus]GEO04196.1 hypothetical protein AAE02nite_18600 [Adhaeribacter aerolatus]